MQTRSVASTTRIRLTTPVTITPYGCGYKLRWDPLDARYDGYTLCDPGHRIDIAEFVSFHNFASQPDRKDFTCVRERRCAPSLNRPVPSSADDATRPMR
ncbi:MAG: hypothetical protein NVS3B21_20300 [Acidimicrobiales bacterium]